MDAWQALISALVGAFAVPTVAWPQHRVMVVSARWDIAPGPEPQADPDAEPLTEFEKAVLARLEAAGALHAQAVALHLLVPRASALKALQRLAVRGLVVQDGETWRVC